MSLQEGPHNAPGVNDQPKHSTSTSSHASVLESPHPTTSTALQPSINPSTNSHGSFKKLLNSHLSIYNALNNPDLDVSPNLSYQNTARFTPDLDPLFLITSWQSVSNESFDHSRVQSVNSYQSSRFQTPSPAANKPASILSITTDEDAKESIVIVQSPKTVSNVMVFETDEEDVEEVEESKNPSSFIMPKMLLSDTHRSYDSNFQITVISSCSSYQNDSSHLVESIGRKLDNREIIIKHLVLEGQGPTSSKALKKQYNSVKNSSLVFIINDGSKVLVEFLSSFLKKYRKEEECEQNLKLTIINVMTFNYFITLFDLINSIRPYQIWKTSSLKNEKLLDKLKDFVKVEFSQSEIFHENFKQLFKKNREFGMKSNNFDLAKSRISQARSNLNLAGTKFELANLSGARIEIPETKVDYLNLLNDDSICTMKPLNLSKSDALNPSTSIYTNLISTKKPDYKSIEKQIKSDLESSYQFNDPLKISSSNIKLCYSIMKKIVSTKDQKFVSQDNKNLWFILSFALGIGLGFGFTNVADSILGVGVFMLHNLKSAFGYFVEQCSVFSIDSNTTEILSNVAPTQGGQMITSYGYAPHSILDTVMSSIETVKSSKFFDDIVYYLRDISRGLIFTGSMVIGGFEKLVGLVLN
ncbi:uncharacterized protein CANTADRAFT_27111 [Suhomyces tanzawaensis NRRL Y-17324]|uniref:Uncharacterized protein n=1 Tax=Suhomyces tanzawaensis NRRL Y-17324 TaxID=984487 RepID=A0A1E4SCE8_9ASCO|nr:uncharacterized protein CANTADRAFT_27111 [Suhomyces tanzawaensis NRRL Y-17324]ODV77184.1 hypothetical protein CANTADRAFT_27111 [Suhomyces tanzawaensis NRRL Y-17324]